ncbi:ATP-binding protein [Desulfocicer niacini]
MKVKNSAIIYTAYDYQTLHGVYFLSVWLNSPTEFERMCFEADEEANEAPKGIDDIVCQRSDGKTDFIQVKFTPSPDKEENHLTWDWLLTRPGKTERSRSILKKLSDAISSVSPDKLGKVVLLTNKLPDRVMENNIKGTKIDISKIESTTKQEILNQLGSEDIAISLFSTVEIQHSEGDYHTLDRIVRSELYKHSDNAGIDRLLNRSREWAMFKNYPPDDGWIYLHHVREILSIKRPEPIPEIFTIPPEYCLPDNRFHEDLAGQICSSKGEIITLTGKPGLGKSTYLSYLCKELEKKNIPLIRHHYFLSLGDTTEDRLSPRVVAESFLHQIKSVHQKANADTSRPENLRMAITKCAEFYKKKNCPFVILIDGLDHVWRDNARNKKPLDEIFRQLLPVVDNMVLLVGTQPVDSDLLPDLLLNYLPKEEWTWLPSMTGNSIYEFLKYQSDSGRIQLNCHEDHIEEEIQSAAEKLHELTQGYPLHVIYSYEYLIQNGKPLSSWEIEKLPPCSDQNIETYYNNLWRNLTYRQKDVLHLCSDFQFAWPRHSIGLVLKDPVDQQPSVDAVSHMLFEGISGVRPFHESLVVFIKNQPDHQTQIEALLPQVCEWLDSDAPKHLKDAWLWSSIARLRDSTPLRQGLTRDWLLDRLIEGFPVKTCIRLLSEAEIYAFDELNFAEAYKHRALKTRLFNGPEFQIWDAPNLEIFSFALASELAISQEISLQNEYSPTKLAILAISLWQRGDNDSATKMAEMAIDRYRTKNKLINNRNRQDEETEATLIIKAGTLTDVLNYDAIFEKDNFSNWPDAYINAFKDACIMKKDIALLCRARKNLNLEAFHHAVKIELSAIRASIVEEADITARSEYNLFTSQKLSAFLDILSQKRFSDIHTYYPESLDSPSIDIGESSSYHQWFFSSLITRLQAEGDFSWLPVQAKTQRANVSIHYNLLNELSDIVAQKLITDGELKFDQVCTLLPKDSLLDEKNWESRRADILFKREWIEIASDCHLLTNRAPISLSSLNNVLDYEIFRIDWLRLWYKEIGLKLLSDEAAKRIFELELKKQSTELEETIEYSNGNLELAEIAYRHGDSSSFSKHLRLSWDFVLGYGHHKDSTIINVIEAIEYLSSALPDDALNLLERISPIVFNISEFTDGDETSYSKHLVSSLLAAINPQTAASIYDQQLKDGEWYYSEETLSALVKNCDFSSPIVKQLFLTGLHSSCYQDLQKLIDDGNQNAIDIAREVENLLGTEVAYESEDKKSSNTELEKIKINPNDYPPESLNDLIEALKGKYNTSDFWNVWYDHWAKQGKEAELIENLLPIISDSTNSIDNTKYLLDRLFISQKKLNGKTKAFALLVQAQKAMNGWSDWYERTQNTINRLKILAEIYPKRIDEFIRLTTEQHDTWNDKFGKLIIPNDKLVFLLVASARTDEAIDLVNSMVDSLEESIRNLSLRKPKWDWRCDDTIEDALTKTLVSRLKLPIPAIKLWVIEQASILLVNSHPQIENLILDDLSKRLQESECIEVLSLFLIAKYKGYVAPVTLGNFIKARSILSDMILKEVNPDIINFGEYALEVSPIPIIPPGNNQFDHFSGTHFPLLYDSRLSREEKRCSIPFTAYFRSEWSRIFDYCPPSGTDIQYFINTDRTKNTGQFYTTASHRARSAFLRTIEIARRFFGMPDGYAEGLSTPALPIEPVYVGVIPKRPDWVLKWANEIELTPKNISEYIKKCIRGYNSKNELLDLAAFSFPIRIDGNNWIDITVSKIITNQAVTSEYSLKDRSLVVCIGRELETHLTYEYAGNGGNLDEAPIQLTATSYPLLRYGHWHSDFESRGVYVPVCAVEGRGVNARFANNVIEFEVDDVKIGYASYWNNYWRPSHPKELSSLCGTYTVLRSEEYFKRIQPISDETKYFYACNVKILKAEDTFREFETQDINFTIPVFN